MNPQPEPSVLPADLSAPGLQAADRSRPAARRRLAWRVAAGATAALAGLAVAACSGGGESSSSDSGGATAAEAPFPAEGEALVEDTDGGADRALASESEAKAATVDTAALAIQRSVISTGVVALRAKDVGELRFDVRQVVDEHQGQVTDEQTESDADGEVVRSRLVVRVPAKEFDATMSALQDVGTVVSAQRTSEDVTTQVIDTEVRVRAQEASLRRIESLLGEAENLRDIVAIEAQLTRRQADLDSLKQQQAWLADQTSMSTINVQLRRSDQSAAPEQEERGFLAGLAAGWHGLQQVTTGALTALGAVLPFAVVLLVLGLPLWLVVRRLLRRRPAPGPEADAPAAA